MKIPQVSYGGVQSLGRTSPGLAAAVETSKGQVGRAAAEAVGATADHITLLQEQNQAAELYNKSQDDQLKLQSAVNQKTGMVDLNQLDEGMTGGYVSDPENETIIGNQRLVPLHKVSGGIMQGLQTKEDARSSGIGTRRGKMIYEGKEKGRTKSFIQNMSLASQNSLINETTNNMMASGAKAASTGLAEDVVDVTEALVASGYLSPAQGKAYKKEQFNTVKSIKSEQLSTMLTNAGDAAFKGDKRELSNNRQQIQNTLDYMSGFDGLIDEEYKENVLHQYDLNVGLQEELAEVETIYRNQGDIAAQQFLRRTEDAAPKDGFSQKEQDKLVDQVITRYHRLSGRDKAGKAAGQKQLDLMIKNYEKARKDGIPVQTSQAAGLYIMTQDEPDLQKRLQVADRVAIFSGASHADQMEMAKTYTMGDLKNVPEAAGMQDAFIERQKQLKKDPLGYAIKQENVEQVPFDVENPIQSMIAMKEQADIASEFYGVDMPLLTKDQVTQLDRAWPTMSEPSQLGFITGLAAMGDEAIPTLESISKNNGGMLAGLGGMAIQGHDVSNALYGQKLIQDNSAVIPDKKDMLTLITNDKQFSAAFSSNPTHLNAMNDIVMANYAGLTKGVIGDLDEDLLDQAIDMSTNGILNMENDRDKTYVVEAPFPDMTEDEMKAGINSLQPTQIDQLGGVAGMSEEAALEAFLDRGSLQSIGNGRYQVIMNGQVWQSRDEPGQPFILDWDIIPVLVTP